jgi:hypothetical protein
MKFKVNVEVTETYEVTVEADSAEHAEETALNMEYSEMKFLDSSVEAFVLDEEVKGKTYYCSKCGRPTPHVEVPPEGGLGAGLECTICHIVWDASDDLTEDDFIA